MSEEEKLKTTIQEIKDIYLLLTEQEPTPDDEIEARDKLIERIKSLRTINTFDIGANMRLFEDALLKLEEWDTLEFWFVESELPEYIQKIINITDNTVKFEKKEIKETSTTPSEGKSFSSQIDITEIVDKVSEQFKGEIEGLKETIETLKQDLEKKDETLKQVSQARVVKTIKPKKESKLPPPKIKIPAIKTPNEVPPQVKIRSKPTEQKVKNNLDVTITEIEEPIKKKEKAKPTITTSVSEMPSLESSEIEISKAELAINSKSTITTVSVEEVEAESVKSSGEDLFNVFSSVGEKANNSEQVIGRVGGILVKEKKKKEKKKKEEFQEKTSTMPFVEFGATKVEENISTTDELPADKDALYQELIALEGRRYSLEKSFKDLEKRYHKGNIDDFEYKNQSDDLKFKLNEITSRINKIRRVIAGL